MLAGREASIHVYGIPTPRHLIEVVHEFAKEVRSEMRLNYLYALTVADINATNPTLWNSWRASLLRHLQQALKALSGLASLPDRADAIRACQERALEQLTDNDTTFSKGACKVYGAILGKTFLRHPPAHVATLTSRLLTRC